MSKIKQAPFTPESAPLFTKEAAYAHPASDSPPHSDNQSSPLVSETPVVDEQWLAGYTLTSLIEIPFAHKWTIVSCFIVSLLVGWGTLLVWPRSYESVAQLMFLVGRENVALDPTATTSPTLLLQKTLEEDVNSALEVLSSRQVAEMVVDRLGVDPILAGALPSHAGSVQPVEIKSQLQQAVGAIDEAVDVALTATGLRDELSDRELAVMRLRNAVEFSAPKRSTAIAIRATSKTPEMAQAIARTTVECFLEKHSEVTRTKGSSEFFVGQSAEANRRLEEVIQQREEFMREHKVVSLEAKREMLKSQLAAIEQELFTASGQLEQFLAETKTLDAALQLLAETVVSGKQEASDSTWSAMRQRVYELELQEESESALYTDGNPLLERTRDQLDGARRILMEFQSNRVDENTTLNPLRQRLNEESQLLQARIAGLRSIIPEKEKHKRQVEQQIDELLGYESELTRLDREVAVFSETLKMLRGKEEETRVIDGLQEQGITNVSLFQPATLVERAVSPNKRLLAVAFAMVGLFGGIALAFVRDANSTKLRTAEQVELALQTPVVGKVARSSAVRSKRAIKKNRVAEPLVGECQEILSEVLLSRRGDGQSFSLGVIGIEPGCGASTLATALAITSSKDFHIRTTLVDADSQQRTISRNFGLRDAPGLAELVGGDASPTECIQRRSNSDLQLVSFSATGSLPGGPRPTSKAIHSALLQFQHTADLVIVDLPAASSPGQPIAIARHLDYLLVVVASQTTDSKKAKKLLRQMTDGHAKIVGIVLNKSNTYLPGFIAALLGAEA